MTASLDGKRVFEAKVMLSWPLSEGTPSGEAFVLRYKTCGRCSQADATRGDHRRRQVGGNEADPFCRRQTAISSIVQPRAAAFSNFPKIESGAALTAPLLADKRDQMTNLLSRCPRTSVGNSYVVPSGSVSLSWSSRRAYKQNAPTTPSGNLRTPLPGCYPEKIIPI